MFYCEKCNLLNKTETCSHCKSKNLRAPLENDLCFFVELDNTRATMFEQLLKNNDVLFVSSPSGFSVATRVSANKKYFILYKDFDVAHDIYQTLFA